MYKYVREFNVILLGVALAASVTFGAQAQVATDLNCVSCVDEVDIKGGAVTTGKIAIGSVATAHVKNGAITTKKLAVGAVKSGRIANGAVTNTKIADGAVTFAKLAPDAVFMRTIVVSPVGPTATDNCDEMRNTLSGITDASSVNRYLVFVEPGIYDCGMFEEVVVPSFVELLGSGQIATQIKGHATNPFATAVLILESDTALRDLSVTHEGGDAQSVAVQAIEAENVQISNVSMTASIADPPGPGLFYTPLQVFQSKITVDGSRLSSQLHGVRLASVGNELIVRGSVIISTEVAIFSGATDPVTLVNTGISAPIFSAGGGAPTCLFSYDIDTLQALPATCE